MQNKDTSVTFIVRSNIEWHFIVNKILIIFFPLMNLQWRRVVGTKLYLFPFKAAFRGHMSMSSDSSC